MSILKSCFIALSITLMVVFVFFDKGMAKQKLDQPSLLPSNALQSVATVNQYIPNYIAVDTEKRIFVQFFNYNRDSGPSLATINADNSVTPYPGGQWNDWNKTSNLDPSNAFVGLSGMTLTPDGYLWIIDNGIDKFGNKPNKKGIKIIKIDTKTNKVVDTYPIPSSVILPKSVFNALAVHDHHAYFADKGAPALIIMDLNNNQARRVLSNSSSLYSRQPIIVNHNLIRPSSDQNSFFNVNQIAITPDGKRLYYQAVSGPLYRIDTMYLNDPTYSESELNEAMILWLETPSSGGITCDNEGNLYFTDISTNSIYRFTQGRILNKIVTDPRLQWPAHPFVLQDKTLYTPVNQFIHHSALDHNNHSTIKWPLTIYKIDLPPLK